MNTQVTIWRAVRIRKSLRYVLRARDGLRDPPRLGVSFPTDYKKDGESRRALLWRPVGVVRQDVKDLRRSFGTCREWAGAVLDGRVEHLQADGRVEHLQAEGLPESSRGQVRRKRTPPPVRPPHHSDPEGVVQSVRAIG